MHKMRASGCQVLGCILASQFSEGKSVNPNQSLVWVDLQALDVQSLPVYTVANTDPLGCTDERVLSPVTKSLQFKLSSSHSKTMVTLHVPVGVFFKPLFEFSIAKTMAIMT